MESEKLLAAEAVRQKKWSKKCNIFSCDILSRSIKLYKILKIKKTGVQVSLIRVWYLSTVLM